MDALYRYTQEVYSQCTDIFGSTAPVQGFTGSANETYRDVCVDATFAAAQGSGQSFLDRPGGGGWDIDRACHEDKRSGDSYGL